MLDEYFPGSQQVSLLQMDTATDKEIWNHALLNDYVIVTLDADFHEYSMLANGPPLVVWLKCGNQPKNVILDKLLSSREFIQEAFTNPDIWCLEIY
jgi:predicted nuclease of predicted toxin-antitoxin system